MGTCLTIVLCFYSCRDEKDPVQYIQFIHQECLSKICDEKNLPMQGLKYYGGPEVKCKEEGRSCPADILCCVRYEDGKPSEEETTKMKCPTCLTMYDINDLLVSPKIIDCHSSVVTAVYHPSG